MTSKGAHAVDAEGDREPRAVGAEVGVVVAMRPDAVPAETAVREQTLIQRAPVSRTMPYGRPRRHCRITTTAS